MKKYEYVHVNDGPGSYGYEKTLSHRQIIDEYAKKGYSYIGYIPIEIGRTTIISLDLIFEIEVEEDFWSIY